jgi:hypothetical protein
MDWRIAIAEPFVSHSIGVGFGIPSTITHAIGNEEVHYKVDVPYRKFIGNFLSYFYLMRDNEMDAKRLTEKQKKKILEILSDALVNKTTPHQLDLMRCALIIYDVNRYGYYLNEDIVSEILEKTGWSATSKKWVAEMAFGISQLVSAMNDPIIGRSPRMKQEEFDALGVK